MGGARLMVGTAALGCLLLGACSSGDQTTLATVGASATTQATPTTTSPTGAVTPTTAAGPSTSRTGGVSAKVTFTAQPVPATITGEARSAAEGYLAYWEYVTTAGADPKGADVAGTVGTVATGDAAARLVAQVGSWATRGVHLVGSLKVAVSTATAAGASGTVCGSVQDLTVTADASGKPTRPILASTTFQSGAMSKAGPTWRVSAMKEVQKC